MDEEECIEMFMSITGSSKPVAILKLTEHGGNLNEAVNSHFAGDANIRRVAALQEDFMDIDDPTDVATPARDLDPFSLLGTNPESHHPETAPRVIDVTGTLPETVTQSAPGIDDHFPSLPQTVLGATSHVTPSAPSISDSPDYGLEEQMIQAAIEASKRQTEISVAGDAAPQHTQSQLKDPELENAVSLSFKSVSEAGPSETRPSNFLDEVEEGVILPLSNGRLDIGSSPVRDETEDANEQPLVRHRSRRVSSRSTDTASGPTQQQNVNSPLDNENDFPSEWGGISSEEHDEAVMLEAAMFGGVPEGGAGHRAPYVTRSYMQNRAGGPYPRPTPRPPSPSLTAQRLIREQQDDEYLAALEADREKELLEQTAREAAMEEERRKEEEKQEAERLLTAKEASLPKEPATDDENAVTLLVRMPDGSRRGRRFFRTDKLQYLFDFIDVGRLVKPSTYRLVRPYPRRAFSDGEGDLTLNELGLTSKQEALFLELI